jgi:hypothetical protein
MHFIGSSILIDCLYFVAFCLPVVLAFVDVLRHPEVAHLHHVR